MKVLLTRWGMLLYNPLLTIYVDFDYIIESINHNENIIISIWLFKNLSKFFKSAYVIPSASGIGSSHLVLKLIKKLEQKENIVVSDEKKKEILEKAKILSKNIPLPKTKIPDIDDFGYKRFEIEL